MTFREFMEGQTDGLMTSRPVNPGQVNQTPMQVQNTTSIGDKAFQLVVKLLAKYPMQIAKDIFKTLGNMGFSGNPNPTGVIAGLGKLSIGPIVYAIARSSGLPLPELIAILTSPQFWQAYRSIKIEHKI